MSDPRPSELISTLEEARDFYVANLAGARTITCAGKRVTIVFERDATHVFSKASPDGSTPDVVNQVIRLIPSGHGQNRHEVRIFNLERARLMSLRPGPGDAFTCVSAYPVDEVEFVKACRLKRAKFPP